MKRTTAHFASLLIVLFALATFTNCSNKAKEPAADTTEAAAADESATATDETAAAATDADTTATAGEGEGEATADNNEAVDPIETQEPGPVTSAPSGGLADHSVGEDRLAIVIDNIAQALEARNLAYRSDLSQDCSGIYHQIKDSLQRRIPDLGPRGNYHYPSYTADRSSRQIAHWYYTNNNLHIVQDALADRNKIRPGTVVFFGRTEEKYSNITIELLTNPGKFIHDGTNGKIMHIAVVTQVERDDAGNVVRYTMMHGRNSRHNASRTSANYDGPGSYAQQHVKFPFGNWNQQLVALANIETPQ